MLFSSRQSLRQFIGLQEKLITSRLIEYIGALKRASFALLGLIRQHPSQNSAVVNLGML
jgi:hypothetical protein